MVHNKNVSNQTKIFGICGLKGHGKDTFANFIVSQNKNFKIYHFADSLKEMIQNIFGLSNEQMHNPSKKELSFDIPIVMDDYLDKMCIETGLFLEDAECVAENPRELMQFFGTEYTRKGDPDFWANYLFNKIKTVENKILISDLRFPNEVAKITENDGKIIKIIRLDIEDNDDAHPSESHVKNIIPDMTVGVVTGDLSLPQEVARLISIGRFDLAKQYDYYYFKNHIQKHGNIKVISDMCKYYKVIDNGNDL